MNAKNKFLIRFLMGLALWLVGGPAQGQGFGVGNYQVLSSTRVGRTEFEYVLQVTVSNQVASALGVSAQVYSVSTNTVVVQGAANFGDVEYGAAAVSSNTITIRQNRLAPFNPADLQWFVAVKSMPLSLTVDSPVSGFLTNSTNVVVTGSIGPAVDGVTIGRFAAALNGTNFSGVFPLEEGRNAISVLASNSFGGSGSINVFVTRDTTPPILNIETPTNGTALAKRQVTISGLVNDAVPGTVNPEQATVMVNGLSADILNRSFSISDVLLVPGTNTVTVVARDRAGNESQKAIQLVFIDPASQKHLVQLGGDEQTAIVGTMLPQPLLVELVDGDGVIQTNQPVTFGVTRNDGTLFASPDSGRSLTVLTDDKGQAKVLYLLGTRTGVGNNQVVVTSPGVNGQLQFEASAVGAPPAKISPLIPETQVGEIGQPLPQPWTAYATDSGGNPVAGAPINFTVTQGGGNFDGATTVSTNTDSDGRAFVTLTLGPDEGVNNNVVVADSPGVTNSSAVFTASSLTAGAINATRVIGVVLDNANHPMSNVLCTIANTTQATVTDDQGQFTISGAPVGAIRLVVDAQNRGYLGEWHALTFNIVTVAGRDNSLDRPIYMLQVDSDSAVIAGGDQDVILHLKDVPGATLTVYAHSLRDNLGQPITNRVTWTQVNAERIPMAPPQGSQPILTTAILPAGMRFDPPAQMCIPNSGLPPGQILELYGFDHDIGSFVSVGTATVSSDGSMICSDPGFGIVKSGWHPYVPPPPPCTPVCSAAPADTSCVHYTVIPPASQCDCATYKPKQAELKKVKALANGSSPADTVAAGNPVSFSAVVDNTCFNGVSYHWTFGDPAGTTSDSASPSFTYNNQGTYTVTVTAKCTGCDSAAGSDSIQVTVTNNCVLKIHDDTHNRGSINGLLEVANSLPSSLGDQITASVQQTAGGSASTFNWMVTDTDGSANINKNAANVQFKASPPAIQVPILLVDIVPDVYTVTEDCGSGSSGTVTAYSDVKNGIDIDMGKFGDMADQINLVLGLALGGGMGSIDKPNGKASFENQWKECPTSNKAFWTYKVSAGLNPLIGANYTQFFGPSAFVPSWLQDYIVGGFFAKIEGSINLNGVISSDECNVFQGGIELTGKVGLSIGARAYVVGVVDITIKGGAEIVASGKLVYQQKAIHAQGQIGWSGITASVSVKTLGGWVQFNREWVVYAGNDKWLDGDTTLYTF